MTFLPLLIYGSSPSTGFAFLTWRESLLSWMATGWTQCSGWTVLERVWGGIVSTRWNCTGVFVLWSQWERTRLFFSFTDLLEESSGTFGGYGLAAFVCWLHLVVRIMASHLSGATFHFLGQIGWEKSVSCISHLQESRWHPEMSCWDQRFQVLPVWFVIVV